MSPVQLVVQLCDNLLFLQVNGRELRPEHVSAALREAHVVREHLKHDSSDDTSLKRLGEFFEQQDTAGAIVKMAFRAFLLTGY
jgi:hypothetical protein